jgi:hypothetical protein
MARLFEDTDPQAEAVLIQIYRNMPSHEKVALVRKLNQMARTLALQGLHERHPEASDNEIQRRLMDLVLGEELAEKVYGPIQHAGK